MSTIYRASIGLAGIERVVQMVAQRVDHSLQSDLLELKEPGRSAGGAQGAGFNRTCWN